MSSIDFKSILESAVRGNKAAIEQIIELYNPLISSNSYLNGKIDEDLRQYIIMHLIKNISKFHV